MATLKEKLIQQLAESYPAATPEEIEAWAHNLDGTQAYSLDPTGEHLIPRGTPEQLRTAARIAPKLAGKVSRDFVSRVTEADQRPAQQVAARLQAMGYGLDAFDSEDENAYTAAARSLIPQGAA